MKASPENAGKGTMAKELNEVERKNLESGHIHATIKILKQANSQIGGSNEN